MLDFTQNQTLSGEQFIAAWEAQQQASAAYADARYFVDTTDEKLVKYVIACARFLVFPYAVEQSEDWPFNHERMYKREFRAWIKQSQIHTFCYYWESRRMMVITAFSSDGVKFWDYRYRQIVPVEKPANKHDFN